MWQQWVNFILGIWTIIAAYAYIPSGGGRTLLMLTGIVVAILAAWGGAVAGSPNRPHGAT